jgi:hypothetical protein
VQPDKLFGTKQLGLFCQCAGIADIICHHHYQAYLELTGLVLAQSSALLLSFSFWCLAALLFTIILSLQTFPDPCSHPTLSVTCSLASMPELSTLASIVAAKTSCQIFKSRLAQVCIPTIRISGLHESPQMPHAMVQYNGQPVKKDSDLYQTGIQLDNLL